jgi:hypothetical protein
MMTQEEAKDVFSAARDFTAKVKEYLEKRVFGKMDQDRIRTLRRVRPGGRLFGADYRHFKIRKVSRSFRGCPEIPFLARCTSNRRPQTAKIPTNRALW